LSHYQKPPVLLNIRKEDLVPWGETRYVFTLVGGTRLCCRNPRENSKKNNEVVLFLWGGKKKTRGVRRVWCLPKTVQKTIESY